MRVPAPPGLLLGLAFLIGCPSVSGDGSNSGVGGGGVGGHKQDLDGDGITLAHGDCDDGNAAISPGAEETCNGVDDDCDGGIDTDATAALTWFMDADGDGFGDRAARVVACEQPAGAVDNGTDCNDASNSAFPGAPEICDGADDDCDGRVDEAGATGGPTWYADTDEDGFGDASSPVSACEMPPGYVADLTDCDDSLASVNPLATETCNGIDDDCDATVDGAPATGQTTWYLDADGDGFGGADTTATACDAPPGYVSTSTDCDDADISVGENCPGTPVTADRWYEAGVADSLGSGAPCVLHWTGVGATIAATCPDCDYAYTIDYTWDSAASYDLNGDCAAEQVDFSITLGFDRDTYSSFEYTGGTWNAFQRLGYDPYFLYFYGSTAYYYFGSWFPEWINEYGWIPYSHSECYYYGYSYDPYYCEYWGVTGYEYSYSYLGARISY